jgi:hypothetical protein
VFIALSPSFYLSLGAEVRSSVLQVAGIVLSDISQLRAALRKLYCG